MSRLDELLREKGVEKIGSFLGPQQVTSDKVADEAIPAGDIADNAVTETKLAATAFTGGLRGGGGTKVQVAVDGASTECAANKVQLRNGGVLAAHLHADVKGAGLVAAAGALVLSVNPAHLEFAAGAVQVKSGAVSLAKANPDAKRHTVAIPLGAFTPNATVLRGVMACPAGKSYRVVLAELSAHTVPVDADGTCLVTLIKYDASAAAPVDVVAAWNAEALVAKTGTELTVIVAADANVLEEDDIIYVDLTNNSAAIDTPWVAPVLSLELEEIAV